MRHDFNFLKKNRIVKEIIEWFIFVRQKKVVNKYHQNFSLAELRHQMSFWKIKFCTDAYFYEKFCLKKIGPKIGVLQGLVPICLGPQLERTYLK